MRTRCRVIKGCYQGDQVDMGQFWPRSSLGEAGRRWRGLQVLLEEVLPG